ncbi:MAG: DUF4097 family beta strand repeat protein [Oscillospiraceae bacterium]|nr:DUF4097 family beta strand repeat protein [Oscillospiraceae bacterium]
MKKYIAFILALLCLFALTACGQQVKLGAPKDYPVSGEVRALRMDISAADVKIEEADAFHVESNLKQLTVSVQNGVLTVRQKNKVGVNYTDGMLTLYVPEDTVFESVSIDTGAGRLTADELRAERLDLSLGAGAVEIGYLETTSETDIEGGAGAVIIADGSLRNLDLEMGVGELNLTAALLGENDLTLGVGESNLTLLGGEDNYSIEIEKGLGSIMVDGREVSAYDSRGNGQGYVEIEGGVGSVNLHFR